MKFDGSIAVIGGTGALGNAIARRLVAAGYRTIIGSRSLQSAQSAAASLEGDVQGLSNSDAAQHADLVIMAVPYSAHNETLEQIRDGVQGKIVVDTTVPLAPPKVMRVSLPTEGSAAVAAQGILGDQVQVVSAFHNVAADKLARGEETGCDVLVFGDKRDSRQTIVRIAQSIGLRAIHGGALVNSVAAEAMTSLLIFINKNYKVPGAGLRIVGDLDFSEFD